MACGNRRVKLAESGDGMSKGRGTLYGGLLACVVAVAASAASLLPYLDDSAELVRLRNALLIEDKPAAFDWVPEAVPPDFKVEAGPPSPLFVNVIDALDIDAQASNWERALVLAGHLLERRTEPVGGAIQSSLEETYRIIRSTGSGYCGDYADVFAALALTAGIPVRLWAFSFDGFGGNGHVFNEIWDEQERRWKAIDPFHNYYFSGPDGEVLSALDFRSLMLADPLLPGFNVITPGARPVFSQESSARTFYVDGLAEWYLWWGNNVFEYDNAWLARLLAPLHRAAEQLGGLLQGHHPRIRVLPASRDLVAYQRMLDLRVHLMLAFWVALGSGVLGLLLLMQGFRLWQDR